MQQVIGIIMKYIITDVRGQRSFTVWRKEDKWDDFYTWQQTALDKKLFRLWLTFVRENQTSVPLLTYKYT